MKIYSLHRLLCHPTVLHSSPDKSWSSSISLSSSPYMLLGEILPLLQKRLLNHDIILDRITSAALPVGHEPVAGVTLAGEAGQRVHTRVVTSWHIIIPVTLIHIWKQRTHGK